MLPNVSRLLPRWWKELGQIGRFDALSDAISQASIATVTRAAIFSIDRMGIACNVKL